MPSKSGLATRRREGIKEVSEIQRWRGKNKMPARHSFSPSSFSPHMSQFWGPERDIIDRLGVPLPNGSQQQGIVRESRWKWSAPALESCRVFLLLLSTSIFPRAVTTAVSCLFFVLCFFPLNLSVPALQLSESFIFAWFCSIYTTKGKCTSQGRLKLLQI